MYKFSCINKRNIIRTMSHSNKHTPFNFWKQFTSPVAAKNPFLDPEIFVSSMSNAMQQIMSNPDNAQKVAASLHATTQDLNRYILAKMKGEEATPVVETNKKDRRFKNQQWEENVFLDITKQSYLALSNWFETTLSDDTLNLDPATQKQVKFYTQQMVHAMSPSNVAFLNPDVLEEAYKTNGSSIMKGFLTMAEDLQKGKDPDMTDMNHFKVGENLGTTEGFVVYRNDLMELIQYTPTTAKAFKRPLLIVPPFINKFYIFDLSPEKSMVRWLLDQERTVFVVSWVNPDISHSKKSLESYVLEGPHTAIDVIKNITNEPNVDVMGYCLGGTLLVCLAAYYAKTNNASIASLTLLTTLTDFSNAGDLTTFMNEDYVQKIETLMAEKGYLSGKIMAKTFNMLRPSELMWNYVVNNYYLGKDPVPFDFLYWNSDNTNMPQTMHSQLLRLFYQQNQLTHANQFTIAGEGIDLSQIHLPVYMMSTKEDHIAPWKATYDGIQLMPNANITFVLGGAGHVAGVINHPSKNKYGYSLNSTLSKTAEEWEGAAKHTEGSWWTHWHEWITQLDPQKENAHNVGNKAYPAIVEAPGAYVFTPCK